MAEEKITEGFVSPEEFAHELGVKPENVRNWIRRGLLPCVRLGRVQLVPRDALLRLLQRGEVRDGQ